MSRNKKLSGTLIVFMLVAVLAVGWTFAKGKGGGKGKPKPAPCACAETIELPDGTVCTLEDCGSDCVYACPLPF